MSTLKKLGLGVIAVSGLLLFVYIRGCRHGQTSQSGPSVLKPNESAEVLVDPVNHTITTVTRGGTTRTTLPDHPGKIVVDQTGKVKLEISQFGYEQKPFIGVGQDNRWRFVGGCDLLYFKKLDLGAGVSFEPMNVFESMKVMALLSYTVWSNTRVGVSLDHTGHFGGFVTVRL